MKAINHVSEGGLGAPAKEGRTGVSVGAGGQASASGSAHFISNNTVGKTERFKGALLQRARRRAPVCILVFLGDSFQALVPCVQKDQPVCGWVACVL